MQGEVLGDGEMMVQEREGEADCVTFLSFFFFFCFLSHTVFVALTLDVPHPLLLHKTRSIPELLTSLSWIPTAIFLLLSC